MFFLLLLDCTPSDSTCQNVCPDYTTSWNTTCPSGTRCITFTNASTVETVYLAYQVGCNGDGRPGSPQCNCTDGPTLGPNESVTWSIQNGNYTSCFPYMPTCLTEGLAVLANTGIATCASGTRVEFTAGNAGNPYGQFDSYDIDAQTTSGGGVFYSIPVSYGPVLTCAKDVVNGDCRNLYCDSATCPDAYQTSTTGGCPGMSPQVGCQDTFSGSSGYQVTYFPASGTSCQSATICP